MMFQEIGRMTQLEGMATIKGNTVTGGNSVIVSAQKATERGTR